jgi:hypothetical protein
MGVTGGTENNVSGLSTSSWGVDRMAGGTGAAIVEPETDAGVGSGGVGGVSGMSIAGGPNSRPKLSEESANPGAPRLALI